MPNATTYSFSDITSLIQQQGQASGLSQDQINAIVAVARSEGGWTGTIGDGGTSFGVFQFHIGGVLNSFASWLGKSLNDAGSTAIAFPQLAIQYAVQPGGYLYQAVTEGASKGKSGPDLAAYVEQFGQRSAPAGWDAAASWFRTLFGGKYTPAPAPAPGPLPAPAPTPAPAPANADPHALTIAQSTDPVFGGLINAVNGFNASLVAIVLSVERFFWIVIGLIIAALGVYILVQSRGH